MAWIALTVTLLCLAGGCGGTRNFKNENDVLRRQNQELNDKIVLLERDNAYLRSEVVELSNVLNVGPSQIEDVDPSMIPRLTSLNFGKFSGAIDTDGNGSDDTLRLYLHTLDQHKRFIPVIGRLEVQVVAIPSGSDPITVTQRTIQPTEFDAAFRSGFTGTHYTLDMPMPPVQSQVEHITVKATFTEASRGITFTHDQVFRLNQRPALSTTP